METTTQQQPKPELTLDQQIEQFRDRCKRNLKDYRGVHHQRGALPQTVSVVTDRFTYTNLL